MDIPNNAHTEDIYNNVSWEDEMDLQFMTRVIKEVSDNCVLPNPMSLDKIPDYIIQAAQWFWMNDDSAVEQRFYLIKNEEFCKQNAFNKIITLPRQIMAVQGVYKTSNLRYGNMGDFSVERMMMSSYSMFGGVGSINSGFGSGGGMTGYNMSDLVTSLYEVDTFQQTLNPTLSYNYNQNSKKLIIYGDLGSSSVVIDCWKRVPIQSLYDNYYFFRMCVCFVQRNLAKIYGTYTFKYPGGVEINLDVYRDPAESELEEIKEWINNQHAVDYFFQPNVM